MGPRHGCVSPGGSLSLSEPQFPYLYNWNNNIYVTVRCTPMLTNGCGTWEVLSKFFFWGGIYVPQIWENIKNINNT